MDRKLLNRLITTVSGEEQDILDGKPLDKTRYTSKSGFVIDKEKMLAKGELITIRRHTRFAAFPEHKHDFVEMIYMYSGRTNHHINGADPLVLNKGEILIMNQHARHRIEKANTDDIALNFIVMPQFFDLAYQMIGADNVLGRFLLDLLGSVDSNISYLHFKVADAVPIQNLMENMIWGFTHNVPNYQRICQNTMALLFLELLNYTQDLEIPCKSRHTQGLIVSILREIEENYPEATLTQLAEKYHVSIAYLSTILKRETGQTFQELLQKKRLDKAAQLLKESHLSAENIIHTVGYSNTSYFYRVFRKQYGISPSEYRKQEN